MAVYRYFAFNRQGDYAMPDPGSPWVSYDSTGAAGFSGWRHNFGATKVITLSLGETFPAGTYLGYVKTYAAAGPASTKVVFNMAGATAGCTPRWVYGNPSGSKTLWSLAATVVAPAEFSSYSVTFPPASYSVICLGHFITSATAEWPSHDNRICDSTLSTTIASTGHIAGNRVPNGSFALGAAGGWCFTYSWNSRDLPENSVVTIDGMKAWRLQGVVSNQVASSVGKQLSSPMIALRPNRTHTVSFYAKATSAQTLGAQIQQGFQDDNLVRASDSYNAAVTTEWQRFSFTTSAESVRWAPAGLATLSEQNCWRLVLTRSGTDPADYVYINRVMIEEGSTLSTYAPMHSCEVAVLPSGSAVFNGNATLTVRMHNGGAGSASKTVVLTTYDYYGAVADSRELSMSAAGGATAEQNVVLSLPNSHYRAVAHVINDDYRIAQDDAQFCVVPASTATTHTLGTFMLHASDGAQGVMTDLGFKLSRTLSVTPWFEWPKAEPTEGSYLWDTETTYDTAMARAHTAGISLLGNIYGGSISGMAEWRKSGTNVSATKFGNFCATAVARYGASGLGYVSDWSIWNEPDTVMSATAYYNLLDNAVPRMKAADATCKVWIGETGGSGDTWLNNVLAKVALNATLLSQVDAVCIHEYPGGERDLATVTTPGYATKTLYTVAATWCAANSKSLHNTETGGRSYNGSWFSPTEKEDSSNERGESRYTDEYFMEAQLRNFAITLSPAYSGTRFTNYYYYDARLGVGPDNNTAFTCLDQYGRPSPMAAMLGALNHFFDGATGAGVVSVGADLKAYLFSAGSDTRAVLRWHDADVGYTMLNKKVTSLPAGVTAYDYFGRAVTPSFLVGNRTFILDFPSMSVAQATTALGSITVAAAEADPARRVVIVMPNMEVLPTQPVMFRIKPNSHYGVKKLAMYVNDVLVRSEDWRRAYPLSDAPYPFGDVLQAAEMTAFPLTLSVTMTDGNDDTATDSVTIQRVTWRERDASSATWTKRNPPAQTWAKRGVSSPTWSDRDPASSAWTKRAVSSSSWTER